MDAAGTTFVGLVPSHPPMRSGAGRGQGQGMSFATQLVIGLCLVGAGALLALGFPETEVLWFQGRPLGTVLGIIGLVDVGEALVRRRRDAVDW